jgi:NAD(P)-dependent dehydrogenase (short-subunit alcohol dehydrogenase family)
VVADAAGESAGVKRILEGRIALVTGGGRGLGRATVLALVGAGAQVVLTSRDEASLVETIGASAAPERCAAIVADVSSAEGCTQLAREASSAFGPIDILFNNAGVGPASIKENNVNDPYRFWEVDWTTLQHFHAVNSTAAVVLSGLLVPTMIKHGWGRIVNSTTSLSTMLRFTAYGGSKASLEAHTACMANDLEGTGVTANVLVPGGVVATRMTSTLGFDEAQMLPPEVMAAPSVWLASTASDRVNGRRFVAALWDPAVSVEDAANAAGAPVAWTGFGVQSLADPPKQT